MRNYRVRRNCNTMGHPWATRSRYSSFRVTRKPFGIRRVTERFLRIIGPLSFVYSPAFVVETRNVRDSTTSIASFRPVSFASLYSVLSSRGTFHRVPKIAPKCPSENGSFVAGTTRGENIWKEELVVFSASRLFVGYQRIGQQTESIERNFHYRNRSVTFARLPSAFVDDLVRAVPSVMLLRWHAVCSDYNTLFLARQPRVLVHCAAAIERCDILGIVGSYLSLARSFLKRRFLA